MNNPEMDALLKNYHEAVDAWIAAIKTEEALANEDHSLVAWEEWDKANLAADDAEAAAKNARDLYKDGLRKLNYNF